MTSTEMLTRSRVFGYPASAASTVNSLVNKWRSEDFEIKDIETVDERQKQVSQRENQEQDDRRSSTPTRSSFAISLKNSITNNSNNFNEENQPRPSSQSRKMKHRNLAGHLATFSASKDFEASTFNISSIGTFVSVADSDDATVVSYCMVALSNISSKVNIRSLLVEANAIMKFSNMLQLTKGRTGIWAAALLYYYFSCDSEIEDRVYNTCSQLLTVNGLASDPEIRLVSLYTLSNLLPCIDRARIADAVLTILKKWFSPSQERNRTMRILYLRILLNICAFSNTHTTLIACDLLDLLGECVKQSIIDDDHGKTIISLTKSIIVVSNLIDINYSRNGNLYCKDIAITLGIS